MKFNSKIAIHLPLTKTSARYNVHRSYYSNIGKTVKKSGFDTRAQEILRLLVERYIREGQPVGSKTIASESKLTLSSATIRHILSDLESAGFVKSPHTSAGRVPTIEGYRFFVDTLVHANIQPEMNMPENIKLDTMVTANNAIESASSVISSLTQLAGIVTVPKQERLILRHLEFLPLSDHRVLVILVLNEHDVQNRIIETDRQYSEAELKEAANFVLRHYLAKPLDEIRRTILQSMEQEREHMETWMQAAIEMAGQAFEGEPDEDYVLSGEVNLFDSGDDISKMRTLFDAFAQKKNILHLLDQCLGADGVQIFIGQESGFDVLDGFSLVTAPYKGKQGALGVLGVIGPTRMDYSRAIAAVDVTAKLLHTALKLSK